MSATVEAEVAQFPQEETRAALLTWLQEEAEERNAFSEDTEIVEQATIYDLLPEIDSLTVVRSFVALEIFLKIKIPCATVKPGGYSSRDELVSDLLPKLKDLFEKRYGKPL